MRTGNVIVETLLVLPPLQLEEGDLLRLPCVLLIDIQTEESRTFLHTFILELHKNLFIDVYRYLSVHFGDFLNKLPFVFFVFKSKFYRYKNLSY